MMNMRLRRLLLAALVAVSVLPMASTASARPIAEAKAMPQRIVVGIERGHEREARAAIAKAGGKVLKRGYKGGFFVVLADDAAASARLQSAVEGEPGVSYAHTDGRVYATFVPDDPSYPSQWHLPAIGAPQAWDITKGDASMTVAVLDTGADLGHPDLNDSVDTANDYDFVNNDFEAQDDNIEYNPSTRQWIVVGHGTHVSGIIAATMNNGIGVTGIAGQSKVLPIKVLDSDGAGFDSDIAQGIVWAADHGAEVISMSFGATSTLEPVVEEAITYALNRDVLLVAAAGNTGKNQPFYPAAYPGVLGVSATGSNGAKTSWSTYGSHVDISAPGDAILSTQLGGGYQQMSGTSMAAPLTAGAAALVRSLHPGWTQEEITNALTSTAFDAGLAGRDDYYGFGRLNVPDALDTVSADDEIPGKPLPAGSVSQRVNAATDPHDIYAVPASAGKQLNLRLTGTVSGNINLRLLSPDSTTLASATVLAGTGGVSYPKTISFEVPLDGTYYVDVAAASGASSYTLSWTHGYPTSSTLSGAGIVSWGGSSVLTGTVTNAGGAPIANATVVVEQRPYGGSWSQLPARLTDGSGAFSVSVSPTKRTEYRATTPAQGELLTSVSSVVVVQPKAYLTRPYAPSYVYKGRYFTSSGYLKPRHTAGRRDVKLACYRSENGSWKYYKSVYATNANYSSYTKYSARLYLPYRGHWKIVASIAGDTTHVATTSGARYLTVK